GIIPVAHGQAVATMMGPVMEYNWMGHPAKFGRIAQALGIDTSQMSTEEAAKASVNEVYKLEEDLGIPNLKDQGVSPDMIERLSKEAMKDPQTIGNPRKLTEDDYQWIYKRCFGLVPKTI